MATAFKIEKSVPIPSAAGRRTVYPWKEMEVGDSFFLSDPPKQIASTASYAGRVSGRTFSLRRVDGGVRIWRIA